MLKSKIKNPTVSLRINVLFYLSIFAILIFVGVGINIYYPKKTKQHFLNHYSKRAKITYENERVLL
jgi:Na+/proline symporter